MIMLETTQSVTEVTRLMNDVTETLVSLLSSVVGQIAYEIDIFFDTATWNIGSILRSLVNTVSPWGFDEWLSAGEIITVLQSYMGIFAGGLTKQLDKIVLHIDDMIDTVFAQIKADTDLIDSLVTEHYQQRMFAIYGRIAEVSTAIDAPADYLEGCIQDAKVFAASSSAYAGMSWWNFQLAWDAALENLLRTIISSMSFYRSNPQRIKTDVEQLIVKPLYEVMISFTNSRNDRTYELNRLIENLAVNIELNISAIEENKYRAEQLWTAAIAASQAEFMEFFDKWNKNVYRRDWDQVSQAFVDMFSQIFDHTSQLFDIFGLLKLPGDLLKKINLLPGDKELAQAEKISEVASRVFRNEADDWLKYSQEKE